MLTGAGRYGEGELKAQEQREGRKNKVDEHVNKEFMWDKKVLYFHACTFSFAQAKARNRNSDFNTVHDEIQKGSGKDIQRQNTESSAPRLLGQ